MVQASLAHAAISTVNLTEVIAKLADLGMPEHEIRDAVAVLGIEEIHFDTAQAYLAGLLRPISRPLGLSLGDRACLALGEALRCRVLTADERWRELSPDRDIEFIR
jgi:PIN domain nuclease of toxin-antitoxin system